jgi:hypothetical protein
MKRVLFFLALTLALGLHAQEALIPGSKVFVSTYVPEAGSPFDRVGRQHNEGLETIGNATGWTKLSPEELKAQLYSLMTQDFPVRSDLDRFYTQNEQAYTQYETAVKNGTEASFWKSMGAEPKTMEFVQRLKTIMATAETHANDSVVRAIRLLQREILASSIAQNQKDALSSGCTTACYSLDYWTQKFGDEAFLRRLDPVAVQREFGTTIFFPAPPDIKVIRGSGGPEESLVFASPAALAKLNGKAIGKIAVTDAVGALVGGLVGSILPGAGTASGALVGGVKASATAAVKAFLFD